MDCPREVIRRSPSLNLHKYKGFQITIELIVLGVSFIACIAAAMVDGYIVSPDVYGSTITDVKAEVWTWPLFISSIIYIFGIYINGNWRWSPILRLTGSIVQSVEFLIIGLLAWSIETSGCFCMAGFCLWFIWLNIGDTYRAVIRGR